MTTRRKHHLTETAYACGTCYLLRDQQTGPWVLPKWLGNHPEHRRKYLMQHYGIRPVTGTAVEVEVEWLTSPLDVDGDPHEHRPSSARRMAGCRPLGRPLLLLGRGPGAGMDVILWAGRARSSALIAGPGYGSGASFHPSAHRGHSKCSDARSYGRRLRRSPRFLRKSRPK